MIATAIQAISALPVSAAGGDHIMTNTIASGIEENNSHGRRRPNRERVRSLR